MINTSEMGLNPAAIFQMATGFWISKTLMSAVELDVFTRLSEKSLSIDQIQVLLDLQQRQAEPFIAALSSIGLLTRANHKENGKSQLFSNSELAYTFLVRGKPLYIGDFITMYDKRLYKRWDDLFLGLKAKNRAIGSTQDTDSKSLEKITS